jgi:hypothetical protein
MLQYRQWLRISYADRTKHEHEGLSITESPLEQ